MDDKEKLRRIQEWVNSSHSWLSDRSEYMRGYKAGIAMAKDIVMTTLRE